MIQKEMRVDVHKEGCLGLQSDDRIRGRTYLQEDLESQSMQELQIEGR